MLALRHACKEGETIVELLAAKVAQPGHALASRSTTTPASACLLGTDGLHAPRTGAARHVWHNYETPCEGTLVSRLDAVDRLVPHDYIHGAGHAAGGDLIRVLLDANPLPVDKLGQLGQEDPVPRVVTHGVAAHGGFRVLVLLLDELGHDRVAQAALELPREELGSNIADPSDGAAHPKQLAQFGGPQLPNPTLCLAGRRA